MFKSFCVVLILLVFGVPAYAAEAAPGSETAGTTTETLAKKLQNPVAALISIPLQNNFEYKLGAEGKGFRYTSKLQPVIPARINDDWNFISRPIVPYIHQRDVIGNTKQEGFGDIELELFLSPNDAGPGGIIWGVGPILLFPTAESKELGSQKYGIGPNFCVLKQKGPWTMGILANHLVSYAGNGGRKDISATYLQPFFAHTTKKGFTVSVSSESTYDWKASDRAWTIPVIGTLSQVLPFFKEYASISLGGIYYAQAPTSGPKWGIRATITLLLPEK
ncbi:MAG: transporter [Candidatus Omnitrophica bacterium]|jgi:hypothetical protein|nr:transporter [Candidatus Omnitrophota bacterium]